MKKHIIMIKRNSRFNYLICIYLSGIVFFTLFRIAETVAYCAQTEGPDDFGGQYFHALWNGFRFDTTVSCYLLVLPLLLLVIGEMTRFRKRWYYAVIHYMLMVFYTVAFFGCAADIPYFCGFFTHIDVSALGWTDTFGTLVSTIFGEPVYLMYLIIYIALMVGWWLLGRLIYRRVLLAHLDESLAYVRSIPIAVLVTGLLLLGMRGTLSKTPIRISTAYFCSHPFLNQIGVNPVFAFFKSVQESGKDSNRPVHLIDDKEAAAVWQEQREWPVDSILWTAASGQCEGMNVVVVLMESMAASKTCLYRADDSYTPHLDSLMRGALTFREAYSAGIHTHNGIFATLFSQPAILARQTMRNTPMIYVCGLPQALGAAGYHTAFFVGYDEDYDNMQGFLYHNGFDLVAGEHKFPRGESISHWGLPDHMLFKHVIEHCDSISRRGPFFACCMTCSDHTPYYIPEGISFVPRHEKMAEKVTEYADWSIGQFLLEASKKPWFSNTFFIFVGDHGHFDKPIYDMAMNYNHVPLVIYAPGKLAPRFDDRLAAQIDIAPTLLGLLGIAPPQSMLGVDLMHHTRPYAYFSADDKIGCVDGELFYLYRANTQTSSLYRYKERSIVDLIDSLPERAEAMRRYTMGMTQTSQSILMDKSPKCE